MPLTTVALDSPPSVLRETLKAFVTPKKRPTDDVPRPGLEAWLRGIAFGERQVSAYADLCGFAPSRRVPLPFPQVLALPMQLALGNDPGFPYRLPGMVHVGNSFEQRQPLLIGDVVDLRAWSEGTRETKLGTAADLHTECHRGGEVIWRSTATIVFQRAQKAPAGAREPAPAQPETHAWTALGDPWQVPADQGRRYAAVSGDYNPIHLYGWSARLFGFKRPIVHGMWTLAHAIAALEASGGRPLASLDVQFRSPLFLPSAARFETRPEDGDTTAFRLVDAASAKLIIQGSARTFDR